MTSITVEASIFPLTNEIAIGGSNPRIFSGNFEISVPAVPEFPDYWMYSKWVRIGKIILKDSAQARQRQEAGPRELRDVRIISDTGNFASLMFMWNSKIASFSLKDEIVAVVIESKEIAEGQMAIFNFTWNALPAYKN